MSNDRGAVRRRIDDRDHAKRNSLVGKQFHRVKHIGMTTEAFLFGPVAILDIGWSIERKTYGVSLKKISPNVVNQNTIFLKAVFHSAWFEIVGLHIQQRLKTLSAEHQRLSAMPDEGSAQLFFSEIR